VSATSAISSNGQLKGPSAPAISVAGLTKTYGEIEAVRGIDFEIARGETFGFLGPNGAGKSTTISMLCTRRCGKTTGAIRLPSQGTRHAGGLLV
jgi:ABC-2 type transport system ATP-binding protein